MWIGLVRVGKLGDFAESGITGLYSGTFRKFVSLVA